MILIANNEGRGGVPETFKRIKNKENGLQAMIEGIIANLKEIYSTKLYILFSIL
ncbi:MAG: hypothetical protein ACI8TE_001376 [Francisella sp.]|jgi:hypothetical protein